MVQWIKQLSPNELQAGIECLQSQEDFWGVGLTGDVEFKSDGKTLTPPLSRASKSVM